MLAQIALMLALSVTQAQATPADVASSASLPSALVTRSYCRPLFVMDGQRRASGAGFLVERLNGRRQTYLFTAQHLLSVPPSDIAAHVTQAECQPPSSPKAFVTGPGVPIPGAHPMGEPAAYNDVAAFPVIGVSPGLPLANRDVEPGDEVWLLASPASGREKTELLHRARVMRSHGFLAYRYDDQTLGPDQTSGAAIVNAAGEVVGLNIGYTRTARGDLIGVGDRLFRLQDALRALP